jgi:hypothetical protein
MLMPLMIVNLLPDLSCMQLMAIMPPEDFHHLFQSTRDSWLLRATRLADSTGLEAVAVTGMVSDHVVVADACLMPALLARRSQALHGRLIPASLQPVWELQVNSRAVKRLPDKLARVLEGPISVKLPWDIISDSNPISFLEKAVVDLRGTRQRLEACQQLSNCELHISSFPDKAAEVTGAITEDIIELMEGGVHVSTIAWRATELMTGAHLAAVGRLLGRYITHLTLMTTGAIPDVVWSGLWAAFPRLQRLSARARNIGSSTAVCAFCAAAPHALEVLIPASMGSAVASWIDTDLHSTRVIIHPMSWE